MIESCPWCHEGNELTGGTDYCWNCDHRADVPRMQCDCWRCRQGGNASLFPLDLADAMARHE